MTTPTRQPIDTDVRQGYAAWAEGYDAQDNPMIAAAERHLDLHPLPFAGARVLDMGCGTGRVLARALAQGAAFAAGLDGSPEMLARATARLAPAVAAGRARLVQAPLDGDWSAVPTDADLAVITLVLEHETRVAPVIARVAQHLRPGGLLFVAEIHPDMLASDLGGHFARDGVTYALPSHVHDEDEFTAALAAAGFEAPVFDTMRADAATIAAIPKFARRAGSGVLLALRARRRVSP
ncbi:class I SAM-dependent methyltransferase [Reyranella sp.]|uniref:class I SAM-dependent methyltransferase n=1 Tax=Reyranella sp. TaxID=1929291 RepID=UPI003BAC1C0D